MPNTPSKREAFEVDGQHIKFGDAYVLLSEVYNSEEVKECCVDLNAALSAYIADQGLVKVEVTVVHDSRTNHFVYLNGECVAVERTREDAKLTAAKWRNILKGA